MQQAWCDYVSTEVTGEDAFNAVASKVLLLPREPVKDDSLFSTPARSLSVNTRQCCDVKVSANVVKSIHHFCVLPDGLQLPAPYRGVWQQHHRQMSSLVSDVSQEFTDGNICETSVQRAFTNITVVTCTRLFLLLQSLQIMSLK